ncbi:MULTISPECIES: DUF4275 family protein [unclassified Clostridium]|uniref:DUF4275 family protein n=1 Tax=unclassified Clostridium TaxID=2614128 RepID=UPI000297DCBC|nr:MULTISPECIES: DUF4275 family protein [unclassified Clostridium]EKQ52673.1 MAG: hypothetical protein A370_04093 [Clostridium sp. Maddingley MBC34-26]
MGTQINIMATVNCGRLAINQNERYSYQARGSKIIWLSESIDLMPDDNKIYEVKYSSGKFFEGIISQVGQDEIGFYIILNVVGSNLRNDRTIICKTIPLGQAALIEVFNYKNIPGLKELSKSMREDWKFVLNSIISFERVNENICILFRDGVLNDIIIKLEIIDVLEEENFDNVLIRNVFIRKENSDGFVIYLDSRRPERSSLELPKDYSDNTEYFIENDENIARICCNEIVFSHYNCFLKEMERRNIDCISSEDCKDDNFNAKKLRVQWINIFAKNIDISKIYIEQHLWHVFSYKRLKCFEKEEANKRFNEVRKKSIYIFSDGSDMCYLLKNADNFTLEDIKFYKFNDIYITDEDFTWIYVVTHEDGWLGPYFYSVKA